jgi:hypothetical protein
VTQEVKQKTIKIASKKKVALESGFLDAKNEALITGFCLLNPRGGKVQPAELGLRSQSFYGQYRAECLEGIADYLPTGNDEQDAVAYLQAALFARILHGPDHIAHVAFEL